MVVLVQIPCIKEFHHSQWTETEDAKAKCFFLNVLNHSRKKQSLVCIQEIKNNNNKESCQLCASVLSTSEGSGQQTWAGLCYTQADPISLYNPVIHHTSVSLLCMCCLIPSAEEKQAIFLIYFQATVSYQHLREVKK